MKLLVADTSLNTVDMITCWLKSLGYEVHPAYSEEQVKIEWRDQQPDLVIITSFLGDTDSMDLCRSLQNQHDALLLVLFEGKGVKEEVRCLEGGADACLRKPFFPDQLLAHIHALERRMRTAAKKQPPSLVHVGPLIIDLVHHGVRISNKTVRLTPTESKILHFLAINAGKACTLEQIVSYVWDYTGADASDLVKPHIHNLRQKVEANPHDPRYIVTVPNVGYMLVSATNEEPDTSFRGIS